MSDGIFGNPEQPSQTPAPEEGAQQNAQPTSGEAAPTGQEPKQEPQTSDPNSLFADQLAGIKAEDGRQKYADVSTALESIPHAQSRIRELAEEKARLEAELQQRRSIEEMIERIETSKQQPEATSQGSVLDEATVEQLLDNRLAQLKQAEQMESNRKMVVSQLTERFGEKAEEVFSKRASELGMDVAGLSDLALKHPKVVLSQFEGVQAPAPQSVQGTVNAGAVKPSSPERKPVAYGATTKQVVEQWRNHATR